jgi:hypothetical protein
MAKHVLDLCKFINIILPIKKKQVDEPKWLDIFDRWTFPFGRWQRRSSRSDQQKTMAWSHQRSQSAEFNNKRCFHSTNTVSSTYDLQWTRTNFTVDFDSLIFLCIWLTLVYFEILQSLSSNYSLYVYNYQQEYISFDIFHSNRDLTIDCQTEFTCISMVFLFLKIHEIFISVRMWKITIKFANRITSSHRYCFVDE